MPSEQGLTGQVLDSGGSSFWVLGGCGNGSGIAWSDETDPGAKLCQASGTYIPDTPEGFTGEAYHREYRGAAVDGFGWQDDVYVGGAQLRNVEFGVVSQIDTTNSWAVSGVMGLKPESPVLRAMKEQSILRDVFFAVSYIDNDDTSGDIVFGGVDKSKFAGPLRPALSPKVNM